MAEITPNVTVSMPAQLFTLARSFKAASNGKIYIGKVDTDPVLPVNQIPVYIENESGEFVPVRQPILINQGGYPVYHGQISRFVTTTNHSMAVYAAGGVQQFYFPNIKRFANGDITAADVSYNGGTVEDALNSLLTGDFIDGADTGKDTNGITGITADGMVWYAWDKPSGALLSFVNNHDYGTAKVTTSTGSYEFVTRQIYDLRVGGHVHGWGAAHNKDSTSAFVRMRNYIKTVGGGVIRFVAGETYLVTNHKEAGDGSYYGRSFVFDFKGAVINGLEIYGAGAKIKVADNSHYGSFDPSTGVAVSVGTGGTVDHQNTPGTVFNFEGTVSNITGWLPEIYGNNTKMIIGGNYGDVDIQIQHTGLRLFGNVSGVTLCCSPISYMGLDGIGINVKTTAISRPCNVTLINVDCQYNGRQGLSLSGGSGVTVTNFTLNHNGMGGVSSAPRAGLDIEPETGNYVLNPRFLNGEILNNKGVGVLLWDPNGTVSGGSVSMVEIWGTANHAVWLRGGDPLNKFLFERSGIHGQCPHNSNVIYGDGCNIDDKDHPVYGSYVSTEPRIRLLTDITNTTIRDCVIDVSKHLVADRGADWQNVKIYCRWDGPTISSEGGTAITFGGKLQDVTMYDEITNVKGEGQRFWATGLTTAIGGVSSLRINGNGALRFNSQTGPDGDIPLTQLLGVRFQSFGTIDSGVRRIIGVSSTTPTSKIGDQITGTPYVVQSGDIYLNGAPDNGKPDSWVMMPGNQWRSTGTF